MTRSPSKSIRLSLRSSVALAALCLAACAKPYAYPHCGKDADCAERGEVCVRGTCQECQSDAQCETKYPGQKRACHGGRCDRASECQSDADCKSGGRDFVCRDGTCRAECTDAKDCPADKTCVSQKCVARCATDLDCPKDALCVAGACTPKAAAGASLSSCHPSQPGEVVSMPTVRFLFNQSDLDAEARASLEHAARCLAQAPSGLRVIVEGHCDDRGTQEYNLALGERRAQSVLQFLRSLGAPADALEVVSKGQNEPTCQESNDSCFAQNRRVQFLQKLAE